MAHEAFTRTSDPPGYDHLDARNFGSQSHYSSDGYLSRSRQSSRDRRDSRPPQEQSRYIRSQKPIDEAVNNAFDSAHVSGISPDLIAQITQNVIQQLKTTGDTGTPLTATRNAFPPPPTNKTNTASQYPPPSPSPRSGGSPQMPQRTVYTPPSPHKHSEHHDFEPDSPETRPTTTAENSTSPFREPEDKRPPSRISMASETRETRPKAPERISTSGEETTLERIWGPLFDDEGRPTLRLGQFLRGLAVHLVCILSI